MTLSDLATLALQTYGVVAVGRIPSAKDSTWTQEALTRALAQLATPSNDIALWPIDDTPPAYADAFVMYAAPVWGKPYGVGDEAMRAEGLRRLRALTADVRSSAPGQAEYF